MTRSTNFDVHRSPGGLITRSRGSMFWRLWWRAISVKRSQAALAMGSLAVGAAMASMLLNLYGDVRRKMTEDFRSYGANVVIAPPSSRPGAASEDGGTVNVADLQPLNQFARETPGTAFAPILYGVVRVSLHAANSKSLEFANAIATGADFGALERLNPGWREVGAPTSAGLPPGECAVGANLAARLHLHPGDAIVLSRVPAEVAQLPASGGETQPRIAEPDASVPAGYRIATVVTTGASEDDQLFVPLNALQSLLELPGKVTLVELSIPGETQDVEGSVHRLAGLLPQLEIRPIRQIVYSEGKVLSTVRWLLLSLTILILVIIGICVMATMTAIVLERRKDIGVMKALGAADALVIRLFMTEGAALGLVGGAAGYAAGTMLARGLAERLFGVALNLHLWTVPVVCGLTVALAVFAAQVPVRMVRAIQPTVVLKGD
jgi:putative ABC transport system permease protein